MQSEINADDFFSTLEEEQEAQAPAPVAEEPAAKPALSADEFFDSIEQEERTASKAILAKDPAVANRERIAAQQMETSRIDAAANLDHYEDIANRNAVREKLKNAPIFTGFLANNQNNAPILQNDIDGFIDIEKRMAKFGLELNEDGDLDLAASAETGWQAARKDVVQNATVGFSSAQAAGEQGIMWANARDGLTDIDDAFKKRSAEYDKAMEAMQGNDSWIAAAGEVVGTMYAALTNSVNETAAGSAVMVGVGMAAGLAVPAMAPILGAAAMGGSMGAMYKIEGGLAYKEMIEKGARPEEARLISQGVGLVNSLIEVGGMTVLGKAAATLLRALTTKHAGKTAAALASPEMGKLVLEASKVMGKGVAAEVTTEVMQELVNVAGEGLAKEFAGAKFDDATGEAIFDRLSEVAIKTLKGTMVLGALGMGPTIVASARKVYKAREAEDFFNALHENMSKSEAAEMAPEVVADAVQQMSDEARIGKVYVDAAEFYQVVKDHGITMEQLEQALPGIGETLAEKALNKEDLVFQTGEYASKIAGTELGKALTQHMRLDPDALSVADATKVEAETKRLLAASMNGKISEADLDRSIANMADDEYKAEYDKLKAQMYESIKATGSYSDSEAKANAKLGAWQVANLVRRAGLPAGMITKLAPTVNAPVSKQEQGPMDGGESLYQLRKKPAPKKTVKAYKLFRVKKSAPGKLFPLFVDANTPAPMGVWEDAIEGEKSKKNDKKVKSRIGDLHYRPGWHAGDLPLATHIGGRSHKNPKLPPDLREEDQVWAEVEFAADVDYQPEATANGYNEKGKFVAANAEINRLPEDGFYRYKTNPNMTGEWLIGGSMKINRILSDEEVEAINAKAGLADLKRAKPFDRQLYGFDENGYPIKQEEKAAAVRSKKEPVLEQKAAVKVYSKSEWRVLKRTLDNMTDEERAAFDEYVNSRPDADRVWSNLERLKDTPWAKQAIEAVFVRIAMRDLMNGREPRIMSMLDNDQAAKARADLKEGVDGLWKYLTRNSFVGNASKPAHNVNSSFINCDPSNDCAKFCYATKGNYTYSGTVIKSELISEAIALDPIKAAKLTANQYKGTAEFHMKKALRLFDKGDGDATWLPYVEQLNKEGVRVQIFSKRPEFLRQISDYNVRLLSIDESNKALADANPDLDIAYVYSDESQIPDLLDLHKQGRIQVILPVKIGRNLLPAEKVKALIAQDKTIGRHVCWIDAGKKTIKTKKNPYGWNCTMCDKNAGVGCFVGQSTEEVMKAAAKADAMAIKMEDMDADQIVITLQTIKKDLDNAIESMDQGERASERVGSEQGSVRGSERNARFDDVSRKLDELIRALLRTDDAGAKRGGGAGVNNAPDQLSGSDEGMAPGRVDDTGNEVEHGPQSVYEIAHGGKANAGVLADREVGGEQGQDSLELPGQTLKQLIGWRGVRNSLNFKAFAGLLLANHMERKGVDATEILKKTGWQRGLEGDWRYEIPDLVVGDAFFKLEHGGHGRLEEFINAPELFKAYPFLKSIVVGRLDDIPALAGFNPETREIAVNFTKSKEYIKDKKLGITFEQFVREDFVHEIQHAIQQYEKFARGTNPIEQRKPLIDFMAGFGVKLEPFNPDWDGDAAALKKYLTENTTEETKQKIMAKGKELGFDSLDELLEEYLPFNRYWRTMGEVESRVVSDRLKLSDEARRLMTLDKSVESIGVELGSLRFAESGLDEFEQTLKQIAWHGSPYRFTKFLLEKIGTGEGAQAHGWGLYFSLDRETAERYRARLADEGAIIKVKNYEFDENDMSDESPDVMAYHTVAWLINEAGPYSFGDFEEIRAEAINIINNAVTFGTDKEDAAKAIELVKALTADDVVIDGSIGGLFKVDIPEDSVMLDEQKAFKDQPEFVQKAIHELYKKLNTKRSVRETAQASAAAAIVERSKIVESIQKMVADGVLEIEGNQHPQAIANSIVWALTDYLYRALNRESLPLWEYRYRQRELVVAEIGLSGSAEAINNIDFDIETLMMEAEQAFGMDHEDMPGAGFRASLYINPEKTGQDIYDDLSTALGSDKEASLALNSVGIKGIRYDGRRDGPCAVVFDEDAVNILEMAQAELDEFLSHIEQANMVTTGSYSITNNSITLTPNANLTTFAHEMGHWYLETLFAIYDQTTSASVRADVETMLKDFGLNSIEAWYKLPMKDREVLHERFAFYVEQYFAEGKAPTKETRGFFQRFGAWIRAWYSRFGGGAKEELNKVYRERFDIDLPEMSDEVRRVLDRMMAAESSIKQAEAAEGIMPLFKQKPEDMDDRLWQQLMQESDDADSEATDKVFARMARDEKWYTNARSKKLRDMQRAAKETRNAIRAKVEKEVDDKPEMKLLNLVKANNMRLSEDDLRMEGVPAESIATLRKAGLTVPNYTASGKYNQITLGALRQWAAFIYKADTNQQVIKALLVASDREGLIEELTTHRCLKDHSELFDPKKMDAAVTEAIHNEARSRFIATELSYLANDKEGRSRIYREAARRVAEQMINSMPIGSIRVRKFVAAEARASRAAFEALAKGDRYAAVLNKRAQLVQHEAALMAIEIEKEMRRVADLKSRVFRADKKLAKTHDIDIINIARYVLTNEGLGKTSPDQYTPEAAMKYVDRLKKYDPDKFALYSAMLDKHAYKGAIDFSRYTVQYAMEVIEDVQMLYRQARDAKTIMLDGKRQDREQVVDELIERFNMVDRSEWDGGKDRVISASGKLEFAWMSFKSKMIRIENWCHAMDGSAIGPFFKYIYLPIANAAAKFRNLNNKTQEALVNVLKPMIGKWANVRDIQAPELGYTFATKAELIGALLHTGNASNKAKLLLGGRGEGKPWARLVELQDGSNYTDTTQWDGFISRCMQSGIITKEDMDVVQQIWDLTESTKPVAQAAFKALYGTYFEEVEAEEIVTPWGNYRGGYVPAITDKYLVPEKTTQEEAKRITQQDFVSQMPVHQPGFSKTRVPNYTKPLALDVGLLCGHIQEVLKFATMAPVAQEVAKILSDKRFAEPIEKHDPTWISQMLVPWLKRSFEQTVSDGKTDMFSSKLNQLRGIAGMNIMCAHIVNALQQWTGLSIAATKVDPRYMAKAQAKLIKGELTPAHIMGMSPYMMARLKDRAFEFQSQIERIARTTENVKQAKGAINKIVAADEKLDAARDWIGRHGYFIQNAMQFPIDTIVWGAAYQQSIDQGMSSEDAVANADSIVRTTQSAFDPENVSEVETGSALYRCFLVFYNYFNMQLNLLGEKWEGAKHTKKYGKFALDSMLIVAIPSIVSAILTQMISGFDTGDDDEWDTYDTLRLLIAEPMKNVIAMAPFLGGAVTTGGAALANADVAWAKFIWGEDPYQGRMMNAPAFDALATGGSSLIQWMKAAEGDDFNARSATRGTLDLLSVVTRMPLGALKKPAGWMAGYLAGEIEPESIDEVVRGLISGKDVSK